MSDRRPAARHPLISGDRLNRATLARQLLLAPADLGPLEAIERIGGLQAQEPASPYLALWARIVNFDVAALDAAFRDRTVVKATLMRVTVHAVTADDYVRLLPAVLPMLRAGHRRGGSATDVGDIDALATATLDHARTPRSLAEIRGLLARLVPAGVTPEDALWRVRRHAPLIHVPSDVPWSFGRRPLLAGASAWLDGRPFEDPAQATEHLVALYLAAYGPASAADLAVWSGVPLPALRSAAAALDVRVGLLRFLDEAGRELIDLPDGPRPTADTPAPPRLLPMWDGVLLAHADRSRVMSDADRARVIARNGDTLPSFLVDGRVAGLWWLERNPRDRLHDANRDRDPVRDPDPAAPARFVLEPFRPLPASTRDELQALGEQLATFVRPYEPLVYSRYRWNRARR